MSMGITRRRLLVDGVLGGALAGATLMAPGLVLAAAPTERRFVFIILRGAMDGLSVVMPTGDPAYAGVRGSLAVPPGGMGARLDDMFTLHPALVTTAALYARGEAAFVHAVASPYRERSHFDAQNVLETGGTSAYALKDGWLNRLVAAMPAQGAIAIAATVPMALRGSAPVGSYAPSDLPQASDDLLQRVAALYDDDTLLHGLWTQAMDARALAAGNDAGRANPAGLGKLAATFLAKPAGPRIAVIELQGWDTHSAQAGRLNQQLKQLDMVIAALHDGLGSAWTQTMVLAATEFGRTVAVNGTGGTDHGTAGVALLAGGAVNGGRVIADWPGLAPGALYEGRDLRPTHDMRELMLGLVSAQFGIDPARLGPVLFPGGARLMPMTGLVRT
jgi:uncharacterized protein (DUF1501 family)